MKQIRFITLIFLIAGCSAFTGEEVGRLSINEVSTNDNLISQESSVDLQSGDEIVIWSEMDIEYEGDVALQFRINIKKDGEQHGNLEINPMQKDLTLGETKSTVEGKTTWSFSGQNAIFNVMEDGNYTFKAILVASQNNSLVVRKAELVLKKI